MSEGKDVVEEEPELCTRCNGSGEGLNEGTTCHACKGTGEEQPEIPDPYDAL